LILKSKKLLFLMLPVLACALVLALLFVLGAFESKPAVAISVTYDADPYNAGQSDPHTYVVTAEKDVVFIAGLLERCTRLTPGSACPFGQIVLHVTYADGRTVDYYPACDSCATIAKNDPDNGGNHFTLPENSLREFRQKISGYIPDLAEDNWWLAALS